MSSWIKKQRIITGFTIAILMFALNVTGVLWTFYRGISSFTSWASYTFDSNWSYGSWYEDTTNTFWFWYWYGATLDSNSWWGSGGSSSSSSNLWNASSSSNWVIATCADYNLVCKDSWNWVYTLHVKDWVSCQWGNLQKKCTPLDSDWNPTSTTWGSSSSNDTSSNLWLDSDTNSNTDNWTTDNSSTSNPLTDNPVYGNSNPSNTPTIETPTTGNQNTPDIVINTWSCVFPNLNVSYSDTQNNWASAYINDLSAKGIMNGNTSGLLNPVWAFQPDRATTRTEFLKMALRAFCYEYINEDPSDLRFVDVDKNSWQAKVIKKWASLGIIDANNPKFHGDFPICRAEAIKILLKVAQTRNMIYNVDSSITTTSYNDIPDVWMAKYLEKAKNLWIIANNPTFRPHGDLSRAETAKILFKSRLFHY